MHYFEWLKHLKALGPEGVTAAHTFIEDWLENCHHFNPLVWHPYPLSLRIVSWLTYGDWILKDASETLKNDFLSSITQQVEHLKHVLEWDVGGNHIIKNLKALIYAGLILPDKQDLYLEGINLLAVEINKQILPDGAHYELSPHYHVDVLKDFLDIHALILKAGQKPPAHLDHAIDQMIEALAFFRHGDGALALFNDGAIGDAKELNTILKRCGGVSDIPSYLPDAGYIRLAKKKALLLADVGRCCPDNLPAHAHADTLSFEFSVGPERIFVNSGTYAYQCPQRNKFRSTDAHNTVCIDKSNSAEVWHTFRLGRRPRTVTCDLMEEKGTGVGFRASHDGYRHIGAEHIRRIFLSEDGVDLRGEDTVKSKKKHHVAAHFHLHPNVTCKLKNDTEAALITKSGLTFSFKVSGGRWHIAKSQYAPHFGERQQNIKLIATGKWAKGECVLKWALQQE